MLSSRARWQDRWGRVPLGVRAVVEGLLVFGVLQLGPSIVMALNLEVRPDVPWSLPLGAVYLWAGLRYFGGRGAPRSTAASRRTKLRARALDRSSLRLVALGTPLFVVFLISAAMLNYRLLPIPADPPLPVLPWWSLLSILVLVSLTAGVSEEAGFRGYMQAPLEKRYGAATAIAVTALFFWIAHLNHPSGFARFPALVLMGVALGALAHAARSITPAIIVHAVADTIVFVMVAFEIGPEDLWSPPLLRDQGLDAPFVATALITVVSGGCLFLVCRRFRLAPRRRSGGQEKARGATGRIAS